MTCFMLTVRAGHWSSRWKVEAGAWMIHVLWVGNALLTTLSWEEYSTSMTMITVMLMPFCAVAASLAGVVRPMRRQLKRMKRDHMQQSRMDVALKSKTLQVLYETYRKIVVGDAQHRAILSPTGE